MLAPGVSESTFSSILASSYLIIAAAPDELKRAANVPLDGQRNVTDTFRVAADAIRVADSITVVPLNISNV